MSSSNRRCLNDVNVFCYICGEFTLTHNRRMINDHLKKLYLAYFEVHLGNQDKSWVPHIACHTCREHLEAMESRYKERFGLRRTNGLE